MKLAFIRLLDVSLSLVGIICALPFAIIIYVVGLFDTGAPLFFQQRVGRHQRPFTLVKFRTMRPGTGSVGTHLVDADAVTSFGHFLRKTKLDELPQLINVLLGHMSLVGPRPCLPNQIELIDERDKRGVFKIRPGITGIAQVNEVDMSTPRKLARYDKLMMERLNLRTYFALLCATALGKGSGDRVRQQTQATPLRESSRGAD